MFSKKIRVIIKCIKIESKKVFDDFPAIRSLKGNL